jgi:hypothetical protein
VWARVLTWERSGSGGCRRHPRGGASANAWARL